MQKPKMQPGRVLNQKLKRELRASRGALSAIISIIVVGVCMFVGLSSLYFNLEQSRLGYYAQCRMADFWLDLKKVPLSEMQRLDAIPGLMDYRARITFGVTVDLADELKPLSGIVYSLPEEPAPTINDILIQQGGYFTPHRQEEVIINHAFAKARGLQPGDQIHLLLNNRREQLTIVGTASSSEFVYLLSPGAFVPDPKTFGVFYLKRSYMEEVFDFEGAANQIVGRLTRKEREYPAAILKEMEIALDEFGVFSSTPLAQQASHWFLTSEIEGLKTNVTILPTIFFAVAAVILNVLMTRLAEQQRTVVGTLKALGYSNRELFWHYLKYGGLLGLIGGLLGSALGYLFAGQITVIYRDIYEFPSLVNRVYPLLMLIGIVISLFFSVMGALHGVRKVLRLSPAEAMRPKPPELVKPILLERWRAFWQTLGFRWQMVLRGLFRNRFRSASGIFASAMGAALIMVTLFSRDAILEMVRFQFDKLLIADFEIAFKDEQDYGAVYEVQRLHGVDFVEPLFHFGCTFENGYRSKKGSITGILRDAQLTVPRTSAGDAVTVPEVGLLLTRKLADILDVEAGDRLTILPVKGVRDPLQIPVARIIDSYLGLSAYADYEYLNRIVGEEGIVSAVQLKANPNRKAVAALYRDMKQLPAIQSVNAIRDQKANLMELLVKSLMISIVITIGFAGVLYFGSVLNASLISLAERRQEIATFRVMGYTSAEVGVIMLYESLCLNLLGSLAGLPLGYVLCVGLTQMYDTELFRIPFTIALQSWLAPIILGLIFTLAAHWPVHRTISNLDWLDALNVKE